MTSEVQIASVVTLDYNDLVQGVDLVDQIRQAYGFDGLGVLTIKNIPGFVDARQNLLPLAREFAILPEEIKNKYVHEASFYSFGWSHGKEKLQGVPDHSKGSYYANPQYDRPVDDEETISKYSSFIHPNIWPTEDLPALEPAFKTLGQLIVSVGSLLAKQCDDYVRRECPSYPTDKLRTVIDTSRCCKARLLHYFPQELTSDSPSSDPTEFSSWCGWHNDHGSLTGLTSALFLNQDGSPVPPESMDRTAGLYIRNRRSELVKVNIPADHLAFQIGETAQIHSGGVLQATPHAVRGSRDPLVSRETFAVFMEPMWFGDMDAPPGVPLEQVQSQSSALNLPPGVPPVHTRWQPGTNFGTFTENTLNSFY